MTNSVIQWNCRGLRPNFDELSILIVKHNPLAVCLQEIFLKDFDNITVRGFNLYHKCHETENRASGRVTDFLFQIFPFSVFEFNKFRLFSIFVLHFVFHWCIFHYTNTHTQSMDIFFFYIFSLYVYYEISTDHWN